MSVAAEIAIIDATLDALRAGAKALTNPALTLANSGWQPDGKPPPSAPDVYVSIDEDGIISRGDSAQGELQEVYKINIWISIRSGAVAPDRRSEIMRRASQPLTRTERQILNAVSGSQAIRNAANPTSRRD